MENEAFAHSNLVIGFLGIDKYEYILYISRILYHLGKKVLLVDCSETGALTLSIPCPEGAHNSVLEYRGLDFISQREIEDNNSYRGKDIDMHNDAYDYILVDYGFGIEAKGLMTCDHMIYVIDQQAHNILRISRMDFKDKKVSLIVKDLISCRISLKYIIGELKQEESRFGQIYMAYKDDVDSFCRLNCQYDTKFCFSNLSRQTKNMIKGIITELCPGIWKKTIKSVYKKAAKGD